MADLESMDIFSYVQKEKNNWRTVRVPLTNSKDWNMYEHIERCTNVANGWFHSGKNDGNRPYDDIVTPIINVAFRSEGFDVKDIIPYVNDADNYYKSFLVKKFHPQWARKHELDTFIDEVVETSIIYDLVLIKDVNGVRPEVVDLKSIAFCDQTDVLAGPIGIKHDMTVSDLLKWRGKWNDDAIERLIVLSEQNKKVPLANDQEVQTPGVYMEVYEVRGDLPEKWLDSSAKRYSYVPQMHMIAFYTDDQGNKAGITLYSGKDKPLTDTFKALKIDQVRSKGRACGRSIVESLFEPQVWNNYAGIKLKDLLDSAITVWQTASDEYGNQKLSSIKTNTVLKHEENKPLTKVDGNLQNVGHFQNYQTKQANSARELGSASDLALGNTPSSGTPLGTTEIVHVEGQGIHTYRQGKIATFFSDVLYRDLILDYLVKEMNRGKKFSEELSFDELEELAETIVNNEVNADIKAAMFKGKILSEEEITMLRQMKKEVFMSKGTRRFFEVMKDELKDIPVDVFVNIKAKQRNMAENADKITNIIRTIIASPQAFTQIPGLGKAFNELLEESGMSPMNFSRITVQPERDAEEAPLTGATPAPTALPSMV